MNEYELQARDAILAGKPIPAEIIPHVKVLDLDGGDISDLSPLSGLTALEELWLERTNVTDLAPLSGLTTINCLNLSSTKVTDLTPLSGLTSLRRLFMPYTYVSDLTPLSGLTKLERLHVHGTKVTDFSPVEHVKYVWKDWKNSMDESEYDLEALGLFVQKWHKDRNLIDGSTDKDQFMKLTQEVGELSDSICKGDDIRDDIGDILVVLINIATRNGLTLQDCLVVAYVDIKDRKGQMVDGVFVKEGG